MNLTISNGRIIDPANNIDTQTDLHIADGRILALGQAPAGFEASATINASNKAALNST